MLNEIMYRNSLSQCLANNEGSIIGSHFYKSKTQGLREITKEVIGGKKD